MYYIMECNSEILEDGSATLSINNSFKLAGIRIWKSGKALNPEKTTNIPKPIEIDFDAFNGYNGPPPALQNNGITLMSKHLCDVLIEAGVDNLELFPAILTNNQTEQRFDYYAFNILGLVAAMDLQKSSYETYRNSEPFASTTVHYLVLDESKIHDMLLFRLAEKVSAIIVHESIKDSIEAAGINSLTFVRPEDYLRI